MGTIDNINDLNKSDFLSIFGNVFEKTESVAQEAFESKPFKDFDDIVFKMLDIYENYKKEKILEILNAHPELAIAKKMTSESISCLLYTSPSPRDRSSSRMPSSA